MTVNQLSRKVNRSIDREGRHSACGNEVSHKRQAVDLGRVQVLASLVRGRKREELTRDKH